ncbi:MAG: DNA gyrase subunit A [Candidatus Paceibacterota bacterium]|jgi:DNA gyrase subunit A
MDNKSKIISQPIVDIMQRSYLDYAMSVIVSRALPDVRDGLKPVHRRILYAMYRLGLTHDAKLRKSALVVGDVLGKYHPHSDTSVYDALARMAQDFSLRYPLIRGQGNFGSLDGDKPAAMRYTEAKLEKITGHLLEEIDKETVRWVPNYDNSRQEPSVLPAKFPNLLLTGSVGIAVGMATNIPPHNFGEVIDATTAVINKPTISPQELSEIIPGPDFPTGGIIYDSKAISEAYAQGKGGFVCRAKAEIEESKGGNYQIIVSELIWQVNKSVLVERIAELVKLKKLVGIRGLRDESNREGVRIVIELKKGFQPKKILNKLYKLTDLQKTYHLNLLALVDGIQPQILSLKEILEKFVEHRLIVIKKRSEFELREAEARAHILEGFSKAIKNIEEIIETIKKSKDKDVAQKNLVSKFGFSEIQAEAILKMRLQALAGLERKRIEDELIEKKKLIGELKDLISSPDKIKSLLKKELAELRHLYSDERRTKVISRPIKSIGEDELVQEQDIFITITNDGYIKRSPLEVYKQQHRAGMGVSGIVTKEEDVVRHLLFASTTDQILFFTDKGKVLSLRAYEIPEASRTSKGKPMVNIVELDGGERVTAVLILKKQHLENQENVCVVMATQGGIIKKTPIKDFTNIRKSGIRAIRLNIGDFLGWADIAEADNEIFLATKNGQSIRFPGKDVRSMGRNSTGVRAIRLKDQDKVKCMTVVGKSDKKMLVLISENGLGKKTSLDKFRAQKRGGSGIKAMKVTPKTGPIASALFLSDEENLIIISKHGKVIRMTLSGIPVLGRNTQGVRIMKLKDGDSVADFIAF